MAKIPIKIPRGKGPTGPSNQAAARNRKKWKQQIARDYPIVDKKSGKRFKTAEAARQYSATRTEIKSGQIKVKEATRSQERSNITQTLKTNNNLVRGKYRKGKTRKLADGSTVSIQGMTVAQVTALQKQTAKEVRIAAQNKDKGKATWRRSGGGVDRSDDLRLTGTNIAETGGTLPQSRHYYTPKEKARGIDIENIPIPKRRNKKGEWVQANFKTVDYEIHPFTKAEASSFENHIIGRKLTAQEKKQGYVKIYAGAAAGAASIGMIGSAYAEPGPAPRPGAPMAGIVAIGGDFFQGVRNTASDWTFGATERGGVPSLDVESKGQFAKVTEGAMDQGYTFLFDHSTFQKQSAAGNLPFDQAWSSAGKFAAEKPATFAGEILGEAAFWAGTMGMGRAVWGVGRGVKLAKLATGPHTTASKAQASQYATIGQGAKAGLKEAGAVTKKDPFGLWTMGYGGIGKSGRLSGKTKHSVGVVPGFESLGQTNVGRMRKAARDAAETRYLATGKPAEYAGFPFQQLALPGATSARVGLKKARGKKGVWASTSQAKSYLKSLRSKKKSGKRTTITLKKKLKTRADYLAHVRKKGTTKRQRKEDKMIDDANDSWVRSFYSN